MKYIKKEMYFRDIIFIINRIKDIIRIKDIKLIRNNFQICLYNEVLK